MQPSNMNSWAEKVDWIIVTRGAVWGMLVLFFAGILRPLIAAQSPGLAFAWLIVGTLLAFVVGAWRSGTAPSPVLTGAFAGLFSYTLNLPLIFMATTQLPSVEIIMLYAVLGAAVGSLTGYLMGKRASRRPQD